MTGYEKLMNRVAAGERIVIDGATGTEIERRGVPQLDNAWNGGGALSHPDTCARFQLLRQAGTSQSGFRSNWTHGVLIGYGSIIVLLCDTRHHVWLWNKNTGCCKVKYVDA